MTFSIWFGIAKFEVLNWERSSKTVTLRTNIMIMQMSLYEMLRQHLFDDLVCKIPYFPFLLHIGQCKWRGLGFINPLGRAIFPTHNKRK